MSSLQFSEGESLDFSLESSGARTPPMHRISVSTPSAGPMANMPTKVPTAPLPSKIIQKQPAAVVVGTKSTAPAAPAPKKSSPSSPQAIPSKALNTTTPPQLSSSPSVGPSPHNAANVAARRSVGAVSSSSDALSFGDDLSSVQSAESRRQSVSLTPFANAAAAQNSLQEAAAAHNLAVNNSSATSADFASPLELKATNRPETAKPSTSPINTKLQHPESQIKAQLNNEKSPLTAANVSASNDLLSSFDAGSTSLQTASIVRASAPPTGRRGDNGETKGTIGDTSSQLSDFTTTSPTLSFSLAAQSQKVKSMSVIKGGAATSNEGGTRGTDAPTSKAPPTVEVNSKEVSDVAAGNKGSIMLSPASGKDPFSPSVSAVSAANPAVTSNTFNTGGQDSPEGSPPTASAPSVAAALPLPRYTVAIIDDTASTHTSRPTKGAAGGEGSSSQYYHSSKPMGSSTNTFMTNNNLRSQFGTHDTSFADNQSDYTTPSARPGTAKPTTATNTSSGTPTNLLSSNLNNSGTLYGITLPTGGQAPRKATDAATGTATSDELSLAPEGNEETSTDRSVSFSHSQVASLKSESTNRQVVGAAPPPTVRPLPRAPTPNKQQPSPINGELAVSPSKTENGSPLQKELTAASPNPKNPSKHSEEDEDVDLSGDEDDDVKTASEASDVPTTVNTPKEGHLQVIPEVRMRGATAVSALVLANTTLTAEEFMRIQNMYQEYKHGLQTGEASDREELHALAQTQLEKIEKLFAKEHLQIEEMLKERAYNEALRLWKEEMAILHASEQKAIDADAVSFCKDLHSEEMLAFKTMISESGSEVANYFARTDLEAEERGVREALKAEEISDWEAACQWNILNCQAIDRLSVEKEELSARKAELIEEEGEQWAAFVEKFTARWDQISARARAWVDDIKARQDNQLTEEINNNQNIELCEIREPRARNIVKQTERVERHAIRRFFQAELAEVEAADHEAELYRIATQYILEEINAIVTEEESARGSIQQASDLLLSAKLYSFETEQSVIYLQLCEVDEADARIKLSCSFMILSEPEAIEQLTCTTGEDCRNGVGVTNEAQLCMYAMWQQLNLSRRAAFLSQKMELMKSEGQIVHHFASSKYEIFAFEESQRRLIAINEATFWQEQFGFDGEYDDLGVRATTKPDCLFAKATEIASFLEAETAYRTPIVKEWLHSCWGISKAAKRIHKQATEEVAAREQFINEYARRLTKLAGEEDGSNEVPSTAASNLPLFATDTPIGIQTEIAVQCERAASVLYPPKPPTIREGARIDAFARNGLSAEELKSKTAYEKQIERIIRDYDNGVSAPGTFMRSAYKSVVVQKEMIKVESSHSVAAPPLRPHPPKRKDGGVSSTNSDHQTTTRSLARLRLAVTEEDEYLKRQQLTSAHRSTMGQLFHTFEAFVYEQLQEQDEAGGARVSSRRHFQLFEYAGGVHPAQQAKLYPWDVNPMQVRPVAKLLPNPLFKGETTFPEQ